jgi:hypothetical protein
MTLARSAILCALALLLTSAGCRADSHLTFTAAGDYGYSTAAEATLVDAERERYWLFIEKVSGAEFMRSLACCRAVLALQWLGWAGGWAPPKEHQRDWAAELRMWLERI